MTTKRILLVEDEALIAMDLAAELESRDHQVVGPFGRQDDAMAALEKAAVDVALLDVNLGGETSYALADALIEKRVAIVFLSGHERAHLPARFQDATLLSKPVLYDRLIEAIEKIEG